MIANERKKFPVLTENIICWMEKKEMIVGLNSQQAESDKKKLLRLQKVITTIGGFFTDVPGSVRASNRLAGLRSSQDDFREALERLAPLCDIIGTNLGNSSFIAFIYADEMSVEEVKNRFEQLFQESEALQSLMPNLRAPFMVHPVLVLSDSSKCASYQALLPKVTKSTSILWTNRHLVPGIICTADASITWSTAKGTVGLIHRGTQFSVNLIGKAINKEISVYPITSDDVKELLAKCDSQ